MNLRICLLTTLSALCMGTVQAQDKIYKRNGEIVEGKVKEVGVNTISYKKSSNPDGPVYTIDKTEIDHITYQSGEGENFNYSRNNRESRNALAEQYGNNIISAAPLQVTDNGVGIALSYERVLDKKGIASFYFPMTLVFENSNSGHSTWYFMPGVKFYPTGSKSVIRYSVGPSLVFMKDKESYTLWHGEYPNYYFSDETENIFLFGTMVNNTLNINPTPHLHMALEFGIGIAYTGNDFYGRSAIGMAQFGFQIGYRF